MQNSNMAMEFVKDIFPFMSQKVIAQCLEYCKQDVQETINYIISQNSDEKQLELMFLSNF